MHLVHSCEIPRLLSLRHKTRHIYVIPLLIGRKKERKNHSKHKLNKKREIWHCFRLGLT